MKSFRRWLSWKINPDKRFVERIKPGAMRRTLTDGAVTVDDALAIWRLEKR